MTFGDLFAGIGGFRLGLERAGHVCEWACEIDDFCRKVYLKHWPDTEPFYADIRDVESPPYVDLLCGGFPCQDLSLAGKQAGIEAPRSGLWSEFARLIRTVRPRYALVENVPGLLVHGMERVLGDLAEIGYDAEWESIPAAAVGAPHIRDRVWILAHASSIRSGKVRTFVNSDIAKKDSNDARQIRCAVADADTARLPLWNEHGCLRPQTGGIFQGRQSERTLATCGAEQWTTEPDVGRVAHGVSHRVDRLKSLGNAVVPQVVEWIARRLPITERGVR
jgi:DNA (cytosine-5)-methyltransferase 1